METGLDLIAKERKRQIEKEDFTIEHDDGHYNGELNQAGRAYFYNNHKLWPWDLEYFKAFGSQKRNCEKAGALIQAEIDRLERFKLKIANEIDELLQKEKNIN